MFIYQEIKAEQWIKKAIPLMHEKADERAEKAGREVMLSGVERAEGTLNDPIIIFETLSTGEKNSKKYNVSIQFINAGKIFSKNGLSKKSMEEVYNKCNTRVDCTCPFWHYGGLRYEASLKDAAINPTNEMDPIAKKKYKLRGPSPCKHILAVIRILPKKFSVITRLFSTLK